MKDWLTVCLQRIEDALHERTIRKLQREYRTDKAKGRPILADAVMRDLLRAVEMRSPEQWARMERKTVKGLDPHARMVYDRVTKG